MRVSHFKVTRYQSIGADGSEKMKTVTLAFHCAVRHNAAMNSRLLSLLGGLVAAAFMLPALLAAEKSATPRIDVILWFDTEDYLLPADDDA